MRIVQKKIVLTTILGVLCIGLIVALSSWIYSGISPNNYEIPQQVRDDDVRNTNYEIPGQARDDSKVAQDADNQSDLASFEKSATFKIIDQEFEVTITDDMSVYDAMNVLKEEGKITFEGKNYPGLGFFVTKISPLESGDGKNLMYDINGIEASVGISNYVLKEGDIIEWKLK